MLLPRRPGLWQRETGLQVMLATRERHRGGRKASRNRKGCGIGYALAAGSCEKANSVDACTATAPDATAAFAAPNPGAPSQVRRSFSFGHLPGCPPTGESPSLLRTDRLRTPTNPFSRRRCADYASPGKESMPVFGAKRALIHKKVTANPQERDFLPRGACYLRAGRAAALPRVTPRAGLRPAAMRWLDSATLRIWMRKLVFCSSVSRSHQGASSESSGCLPAKA